MRAKRVVALIASVLLALPLATACSSKGNTPRGSYDSTNDLKSAKSGTVASNKRFTLLWDEQTKSVFFQDKQTSKIWGTVPYEYYFSGASNADLQLYSPITIEYIEPVNDQVKTLESYSGVMKGRIVAKAIENGVQVTYFYFTRGGLRRGFALFQTAGNRLPEFRVIAPLQHQHPLRVLSVNYN